MEGEDTSSGDMLLLAIQSLLRNSRTIGFLVFITAVGGARAFWRGSTTI